ncbi:hypothetical protein J6590_023694 [Homalodisca vitripennis]|nr:hypothetical protein J6590_023694 [Homalodisca vitripennis]
MLMLAEIAELPLLFPRTVGTRVGRGHRGFGGKVEVLLPKRIKKLKDDKTMMMEQQDQMVFISWILRPSHRFARVLDIKGKQDDLFLDDSISYKRLADERRKTDALLLEDPILYKRELDDPGRPDYLLDISLSSNYLFDNALSFISWTIPYHLTSSSTIPYRLAISWTIPYHPRRYNEDDTIRMITIKHCLIHC